MRLHEELEKLLQEVQDQELAERLRQLYRRLVTLAETDPLTGLYNRRYLEERLAEELARANQARLPLSLILIDIDNFKDFNDTLGHPVGDQLLQNLTVLFRRHVRDRDVVARYGGEEFAIILPGADTPEAKRIAERIRQVVASFPFRERTITICAGLATYPRHGQTQRELIEIADAALYCAKAQDKNKVLVAPVGPPSQVVVEEGQPVTVGFHYGLDLPRSVWRGRRCERILSIKREALPGKESLPCYFIRTESGCAYLYQKSEKWYFLPAPVPSLPLPSAPASPEGGFPA